MSRLSSMSCNQFSGYINAVNLYSIGYCWPTLDRLRHAHFAVEWFLKLIKRQDMFKRTSKLSGVHVSSAESLERTWKTSQSLIRTWETLSDRDGPGGNVLASVIDRGPNRTAPLSHWESTTCDPSRPVLHTVRGHDRPLENVARPNKNWKGLKSHGALRFEQTWPP